MLSLPLRFAPGRDTLAQVDRRALADGSIWLGIPFHTQIDGSQYQFVNCGPASLTMVLAGFGLDVGPDEVRNYLNSLTHDFSTDVGTSLDVLSTIGRQAGLLPIDLYSGRGGYRTWTADGVRWHVQQGHPVITLVKYRNLPGHFQSPAEFDHYIVITGLTPDGFIYNDAAFATTVGYGLEISDAELETAWDNSSIPHNAVALALPQSGGSLSFPELPRPTAEPHHVQGGPLFGTGRDGDLPAEQLPLPTRVAQVLPALVADPNPAPALPEEAAPVEYDDATLVPADPAAESLQVAVNPDPGPLRLAPQIAVLLGSLWAGAMAWAGLGVLARRLPAFSAAFVRAAVLLASFRAF